MICIVYRLSSALGFLPIYYCNNLKKQSMAIIIDAAW